MKISEIIWKEQFVEKLETKHAVYIEEVEEIIFGKAHFRRAQKGRIKGEDLYAAYGQTFSGRFLVIFFIRKSLAALPISARDMTNSERNYYERQAEAN